MKSVTLSLNTPSLAVLLIGPATKRLGRSLPQELRPLTYHSRGLRDAQSCREQPSDVRLNEQFAPSQSEGECRD